MQRDTCMKDKRNEAIVNLDQDMSGLNLMFKRPQAFRSLISVTTTKTFQGTNGTHKPDDNTQKRTTGRTQSTLRASLYKSTCSQPRNRRHLNQNSSLQIANTILHCITLAYNTPRNTGCDKIELPTYMEL